METRIRTYGDVTYGLPFGLRHHTKISRQHSTIYSTLYRSYLVAILSPPSTWPLPLKVGYRLYAVHYEVHVSHYVGVPLVVLFLVLTQVSFVVFSSLRYYLT